MAAEWHDMNTTYQRLRDENVCADCLRIGVVHERSMITQEQWAAIAAMRAHTPRSLTVLPDHPPGQPPFYVFTNPSKDSGITYERFMQQPELDEDGMTVEERIALVKGARRLMIFAATAFCATVALLVKACAS